MQFESPRISARLEHIASKMSCGPDILDWLSGLVVPLLLGALTLAVAIWAGRIAKAANDQSKLLYEQSANETARRLRIPYATELSLMTEGVLNARTQGKTPRKSFSIWRASTDCEGSRQPVTRRRRGSSSVGRCC